MPAGDAYLLIAPPGLCNMSKEMPDLFVALSKRLEPRDLASIVQMASD